MSRTLVATFRTAMELTREVAVLLAAQTSECHADHVRMGATVFTPFGVLALVLAAVPA